MGGWAFLGGAAALTLAITCFGHLRNLLKQVASRVIVTITVSGHQADALLLYTRQHLNRSRFGTRAYIGWKLYYRPERRVKLMPLEVLPTTGRLYWKGFFPVWIAKSKDLAASQESSGGNNETTQSIDITYARGTLDADDFVLKATDYYNSQTQAFDATGGRRHSVRFIHGSAGMSIAQMNSNRQRGGPSLAPSSSTDIRGCLMHRPLGFDFSNVGFDAQSRQEAIDRLALCPQAELLVEESRRWRATERWHQERQLPWRRGFLLYGPPGTGKTALARAIAEDLDLPIHVFDLASLKNDELQRAWNQMLEEVPCMALMEDIDTVFHGRKNVAIASGPALTFDCLLNCLDGVQRSDGLLTILTTNHLDRIDPAIGQPGEIGSRPGRVDRVVHLGKLDSTGREKIASRILRDHTSWIDALCRAGSEDTPAQFQERCARIALALLYNDVDYLRQQELTEYEPESSVSLQLRKTLH